MVEWLGIDHLFELSRTEAIAGFLTPLVIFAVFSWRSSYCQGGGFPATSSIRRPVNPATIG